VKLTSLTRKILVSKADHVLSSFLDRTEVDLSSLLYSRKKWRVRKEEGTERRTRRKEKNEHR